MTRHRLPDFCPRDKVRTPSGRLAFVHHFCGGRVCLRYVTDGDEVDLWPWQLELVKKAKPKPFPVAFLSGLNSVRAGR